MKNMNVEGTKALSIKNGARMALPQALVPVFA